MRGIRRAMALAVMVATLLVGVAIQEAQGAAGRAESWWSVVNKGRHGDDRWGIGVARDGHRRGICMDVAIVDPPSYSNSGESAQCSAPALKRGITLGLSANRKGGGIGLTVFGGAFDRRIAKVQVVMLDGSSRTIPFRPATGGYRARELRRFKYVGLAVPGPWCVAELITLDRTGTVMLRKAGDELLDYSPEEQCRRGEA
jgi:hypothetical protein